MDRAAQRRNVDLSQVERLVLAPSDRRAAIVDLIASAKRELLVSVFRCDDFRILDALAASIDRGVKVRALITPRAKNWNKRLKDLEALLDSMGAEVFRYRGVRTKYHAKYLVADGETALIASLNFTRKCLEETCDFIVLTSERGVVSGLARLFQGDSKDPDARLPEDLSPDLIVGPELARPRLLNFLGTAVRTIRIIDHRLSDPGILTVLRERQDAGVSVQVLGRGMLEGLVSHGRLMLVDDTTAVIGSIALSPPSLNRRREVAVRIRHAGHVQHLKQFFDGMAHRCPENMLALAEFTDSPDSLDDDQADDLD